MKVWIARDSYDWSIISVHSTKNAAMIACERDWGVSAGSPAHWGLSGDVLIHTPYSTIVRQVTEHEVEE